MSTTEPAWNAAISFLDADRAHAEQIAGHFDERARIFVYSRHLDETTGTNGVDKFSQIFGRDAQLVVVLYRPSWGTTGFTRIEKKAIDSRRIDERRSDFLVVVFMEPVIAPRGSRRIASTAIGHSSARTVLPRPFESGSASLGVLFRPSVPLTVLAECAGNANGSRDDTSFSTATPVVRRSTRNLRRYSTR